MDGDSAAEGQEADDASGVSGVRGVSGVSGVSGASHEAVWCCRIVLWETGSAGTSLLRVDRTDVDAPP
jgi:hypothetical protein